MRAARHTRSRRARRAGEANAVDLNLVSLIDVFTILVFFLLFSGGPPELFNVPQGVQLPRVAAAQPPRDGVELAVAGRQLLVQGRPVAQLSNIGDTGDAGLAPLREALRQQARPGRPLVVVADRELPWQQLAALMREAAAAGLDEVSFAVRPDRS